jgi:hypothetical protein
MSNTFKKDVFLISEGQSAWWWTSTVSHFEVNFIAVPQRKGGQEIIFRWLSDKTHIHCLIHQHTSRRACQDDGRTPWSPHTTPPTAGGYAYARKLLAPKIQNFSCRARRMRTSLSGVLLWDDEQFFFSSTEIVCAIINQLSILTGSRYHIRDLLLYR